jgi:pseudouridine-5'-phosphate glycosidase
VDATAGNPSEVAAIAREHWEMGLPSAILVCVPPPKVVSMDSAEVELALQNALLLAEKDGIARGKITPYLLSKMNELTHGKSLEVNLALLQNNAKVAAEIAVELSGKNSRKTF